MISIPMALPLASCQPGAVHSLPDGRAWYGHGDRVNLDTGMHQGAQFTLTKSPREGDDLWIDGNAIGVPGAPLQPWPTLDDLDRGIAECRAALAGAPRFHGAAAKAAAEKACWRAQQAVQEARIAVAEAEAAAERERQEEVQRGENWLAAVDAAKDQPDLSDLSWDEHPALTPAQCNPSLQ